MFKMNIDILSGLPCHRVFICGRDYPWFIYCAIAWWAFVSFPSPTRSSNTRESIWLWDQGGQIAWYVFWMCNFSDFIFTYRNLVILFKMSSHRQLNYYSWVEMNERFRIFMESQKSRESGSWNIFTGSSLIILVKFVLSGKGNWNVCKNSEGGERERPRLEMEKMWIINQLGFSCWITIVRFLFLPSSHPLALSNRPTMFFECCNGGWFSECISC